MRDSHQASSWSAVACLASALPLLSTAAVAAADPAAAASGGADKQLAAPLDVVLTGRAGVAAVPAVGKREWGPEQATGAPDTLEAGDIPTAWASRTEDEQREWLVAQYSESLVPKMIVIHETYNPGAVDKLCVFDPDGKELVVWMGDDPTTPDKRQGISVFPVKVKFNVNRIKVYINSPAVPGWNEIDAVGLRDADHRTVWASKVEASSTFAEDVPLVPQVIMISQQQLQRFMQLEKDVMELKQEVKRLEKVEAELEEIKKLLRDRRK